MSWEASPIKVLACERSSRLIRFISISSTTKYGKYSCCGSFDTVAVDESSWHLPPNECKWLLGSEVVELMVDKNSKFENTHDLFSVIS